MVVCYQASEFLLFLVKVEVIVHALVFVVIVILFSGVSDRHAEKELATHRIILDEIVHIVFQPLNLLR